MSDSSDDGSQVGAPPEVPDEWDLYRLLVNAVSDYAIFALDPNGLILSWNTGAHRLKGYRAEDIIGSHFSKFYTEADIARNHPAFELQWAATHGSYEEEGWRVRKDGTRFWASVVITALRADTGELRGFGKVTRDLTERKMAEDELRAAYAGLEERVKERTLAYQQARDEAERAVRARDEFLSIASHELKTPLTSLALQIQLRRRSLDRGLSAHLQPERYRANLDDDDKQIQRIARLVDDMLDIARINSGRFSLDIQDVDYAGLVEDVVARFRAQFEIAGIALNLSLAPMAVGSADHYRVEQVIANLMTNALKYGARKPVDVALDVVDHHAVLRVRDRGIGISEADQGRIFERFERAVNPSEVSGLGLGLYIVRQIVEAHHGQCTVTSAPGDGSTFTVRFPLDPPSADSK